MSVTAYLSKAIGVGAASLIMYDAVAIGRRSADRKTKVETSELLTDVLVLHQLSGRPYPVIDKFRSMYQKFLFDSTSLETFRSIKNRIVEVTGEIVNSTVPLALSLGAILTATNSKIKGLKGVGIPIVGKICAGLLVAKGMKDISANVLGFGRSDNEARSLEENIY